MKLYLKMPGGLKIHYRKELELHKEELDKGNLPPAWRHLEHLHILGQPWPVEHSQVHWIMLNFGIRIKDTRVIIGQIPRLLVGGVKSFVGTIPVGNTGGVDVPPLRPMKIPEDLQAILKPYRTDK